MPLDLSKFHDSYFDEVSEHLATIERIALLLDGPEPAGSEHYDDIFRAAHSMKGASGIFGFSEMAEATHGLEAVLDALREGRISYDERVTATILSAHDKLRELLSCYRTQRAVDPEPLRKLRADLDALLHDGEGDVSAPSERTVTVRVTTACAHEERPAVVSALHDTLSTVASIVSAELEGPVWQGVVRTQHDDVQLREIVLFAIDAELVEIEAGRDDDGGALASDVFGFFGPDDETPAKPEVPIAKEPAGQTKGQDAEGSSIRVDLRKVNQLIDLVGEMLIAQSALEASIAELDEVRNQEVFRAAEHLARYTRDLRESVMAVRMLPVGSIFARFHRLVRETARELGKDVALRTVGDDTELDKGLLESVIDPLTHLVRNAIDHGIESAEERKRAGKSATATVTLRAYEKSGNVYIEVVDDGRGIDRQRVIEKANALGIALSDDPTDQEIFNCVFSPGFSTARDVTQLSGRGVGMDVVRRNIGAIGGQVDIESQPGSGTLVRLRLPLTLAILDGLSVHVGDEIVVLPIASVRESVVIKREDVHVADGRPFVAYRDGTLPLVFLSESCRNADEPIALVVEHDRMRGGLVVDAIDGQHQVVIKSLETNFRKVAGYSGATVLGNGRVALIVDVNEILSSGNFAAVGARTA